MGRKTQLNDKTYKLLFWGIMIVGILARIWRFGSVPGGLNQDEAFAGYEAWSILKTGMDSAGYCFPVYLTAWGSGMNALNTYLMIPFIVMFGLKGWVIRLPQLLVAVLTLPAVYGIVRRISNIPLALTALFLLAISPWHIMLSRWGLESNLAPGFLIFGLYFFLLGLENTKYLLLSALMYGLSLYCYAAVWPFVPFIVVLQCIYCIRTGKLKLDLNLLFPALALAVLAMPLILFLAVNYGYIDEIRLPFISVPKLIYMRSGEISFLNIPANLQTAFKILITQSDGLPWNCAGFFGQLYPISLLFELLGLGVCVSAYVKSVKEKSICGATLVLIQLSAALLLAALVNVNVNRENIVFIPRILMAAYGVHFASKLLGGRMMPIIIAAYAALFIGFESYYFGEYREQIAFYFGEGTQEAVSSALEGSGKIYVSDDIYYPVVLFYSETPADEFRESVEYYNYPSAYLRAKAFGRFEFVKDSSEIQRDGIYILSQYDDKSKFGDAGFALTEFVNITLAEP